MNFLACPFLLYLVDSTAELPCTVHYHPYGVCPLQRNLRCRISFLMFMWPVISHSFSLDMTLGHHIFMIYRKHLFTKDWSFLWISHITSQVWHPYSSNDFTYTLNHGFIGNHHNHPGRQILFNFTVFNIYIAHLDHILWQFTIESNGKTNVGPMEQYGCTALP
jgi:hypothetical protein